MRFFAACLLLACSTDPPPSMIVFVDSDHEAAIAAFVEEMDAEGIVVRVSGDPATALDSETPSVAIVADLDCTDCYQLERTADGAVVHADGPLGAQYGLAELFEAMGFRFYHPHRSLVPEALALPGADHEVYGELHEPELTLRGLHIHTLHPIEAYFSLWEPSPEHLAEAFRIVDWVIKNRGNFVQWWGLNNILQSERAAGAVREHARAIVDYAHMRGIQVGLTVQLFGNGNTQRAFTLNGDSSTPSESIRDNLSRLEGIGFDKLKISFGEFAAEDPDRFVATLNDAVTAVHEIAPDMEITASVHVGNDLRVTYMGEEQLYYFLVRYADPSIVPWVHTVMYYNLYDDTGGAYHHEDFSEHREFLLGRLANGERAVYYPENAYWIAFDISVPMYLPVYLRSRWLDQSRLQEDSGGALREHATFSSGWEWGYWQFDYLVLRSNYELPDAWEDDVVTMLAPYGARGETVAAAIAELAEVQHQHLIVGRLGAYLAGRDALIDFAYPMGIRSQPDRVSFEDVAMMDDAALAAFEASVVTPLGEMADATEAILANVEPMVGEDRWLAEVRDGVEVDLYRARFAHALWSAVVAHARGEGSAALMDEARAALDAGRVVVMRRHADLHDPEPERVIGRRVPNDTFYQYGYLREADDLCFWERELVIGANHIEGADQSVPGCVL
jgi:hypothetical protein